MNLVKRIVIYLVRKKLGLKLYQVFRFSNQRTSDIYYFTRNELKKIAPWGKIYTSNVALNWLLSDDCKIQSNPIISDTLILYRKSHGTGKISTREVNLKDE